MQLAFTSGQRLNSHRYSGQHTPMQCPRTHTHTHTHTATWDRWQRCKMHSHCNWLLVYNSCFWFSCCQDKEWDMASTASSLLQSSGHTIIIIIIIMISSGRREEATGNCSSMALCLPKEADQ